MATEADNTEHRIFEPTHPPTRIRKLESRRVVSVNTHAAERDVPLVLLGVRAGPAAEAGEVGEGRVVVVVSIPQRQGGAVGVAAGAEDGGPLRGRGVDSAAYPVGGAGVHQCLVPSLVTARVARPVLRALDVQPDAAGPRALAVGVQVGHQSGHLGVGAGGAGGAGEQVGVSGLDARAGCGVEGVAHTSIHRTGRHEATGDHEADAGGGEAGGGGGGDGGAHVDAVVAAGGHGRHAALDVRRASAVAGDRSAGALGGGEAGAASRRGGTGRAGHAALVVGAAVAVTGHRGARARRGRHTGPTA
jgi:hypothetical protein